MCVQSKSIKSDIERTRELIRHAIGRAPLVPVRVTCAWMERDSAETVSGVVGDADTFAVVEGPELPPMAVDSISVKALSPLDDNSHNLGIDETHNEEDVNCLEVDPSRKSIAGIMFQQEAEEEISKDEVKGCVEDSLSMVMRVDTKSDEALTHELSADTNIETKDIKLTHDINKTIDVRNKTINSNNAKKVKRKKQLSVMTEKRTILSGYELEKLIALCLNDINKCHKLFSSIRYDDFGVHGGLNKCSEPDVIYGLLYCVLNYYGVNNEQWETAICWFENLIFLSSFDLIIALWTESQRKDLMQFLRMAVQHSKFQELNLGQRLQRIATIYGFSI